MTHSVGRPNLPERFSELVSLSFIIFGRLFPRATVISAILFLPYFGLATLMGGTGNTENLPIQLADQGLNASFLPSTMAVFLNILQLLLSLIYTAGLVWLSESLIIHGNMPLVSETFSKVFSSGAGLILTGVLTYFLLTGWTLLLIIPGFIFFIYYIFSTHAVILRGHTGLKAISYSKELVKGEWRSTFLNLAGLAGVFLLLYLGLNFILSFLRTPFNFIGISAAVSFLTGKISQAFLIIGVTLIFLRLESKKKIF